MTVIVVALKNITKHPVFQSQRIGSGVYWPSPARTIVTLSNDAAGMVSGES
jgi:hypothetical protein